MKNRIFAAAFLAVAPAVLFAQEGVATFKMVAHASAKEMPGTSKVSFSRNGWRVDMHMDMSAMGRRPEAAGMPSAYTTTMLGKLSEPDKAYLLNEATHSYSVINTAASSNDARSDETWTVKRTGRSSVAGLSCEGATVTSSRGSQVNVCVSMDFPNSSGWWAAMNRRRNDTWVRAIGDAGLKGFPIRTTVMRQDGGEEINMELVSLERRPVPASTFEIPAGFKQTTAGMGMMSPEQQKMMNEQLSKMTPEQRKAYEDAMKRAQQPQ